MPLDLMKPTELHREMFRRNVLEGSGLVGPLYATDELQRSRFFIETMEKIIYSSETAEIKVLEQNITSLTEEDQEEFWQWNYPIHWQDIFGVRIRSAFVVQLCSHIEATLGDIAHRVRVIERCAIEVRHIKGSTLEQHKLYLDTFAKFEGPPPDIWKNMAHVFRIRNVHVHQQGYGGEIANDREFSLFLASLPNIRIENNFIELRAGACTALLEIV
ncbi:hypothetical protein ACUH78_14345 [Thauera sp. ZXT1-4]|uniref:hypothetical protein n=1 Tax=Thauera sp. ZXT1-4 TaxID=3460294 RepID=UPI004040C6EC